MNSVLTHWIAVLRIIFEWKGPTVLGQIKIDTYAVSQRKNGKKKRIEDQKKNEQVLLKIQQEEELQLKLEKWILEENKGEDELLKHLNNSPEQFQHVDSMFFNSNMNRLFNLQKVQREQKRNQYINAYQKKNIVKNNNPLSRFSMKLF